jgi:hypothetical protein
MGNCYSIFSNQTSILKYNDIYLLYFNRNNTFYDNVSYLVTLYKHKYTAMNRSNKCIKCIRRYTYG